MRIEKFLEANLNLGELEKPVNSDQLRGDILIDKISKGDNLIFKTKSGGRFSGKVSNPDEIINAVSDEAGKYSSKKARDFFLKGRNYRKVIKVENETNDLQLNDIEKTKDFGSSCGSSLGTIETRYVECIQCIFLALRQNKGNESLTVDNYEEIYYDSGEIREDLLENIRVPIFLDREIIEKYSESWLNTFLSTANSLYEVRPIFTKENSDLDTILDTRKKYVFYQGSYDTGFMKKLSLVYRSLPETNGIPMAKWTPSDIWVIEKTKEVSIINGIEESRSISELNRKIDDYFNRKLLIGISLKKLKSIKRTSDVNLVINKMTPIPKYVFKEIVTSEDPMGSISVKIIVNQISPIESENKDETMVVRSFSGPNFISDVSGEVMGSSARYGKVGLYRINKIIGNVSNRVGKFIPQIETKSELSLWTNERLIEEIYKMNDFVGGMGRKTRTKESVDLTRSKIISKYQALRLAEILYEYKDYSDEIIENAFYYAMSIKNEIFVSPKYVRIV